MDKYSRYYGVLIFAATVLLTIFVEAKMLSPKFEKISSLSTNIQKRQKLLETKNKEVEIVKNKIKKIQDSIAGSQKKVFSPQESDLGQDSLFFTLYNAIIEIVHSNSVRIKSINYEYNPESDQFVKFGKDVYFVCDINMELVGNYVTLGKLIQDIYQYPYYIKINNIEMKAYPKDKKILIANLSLRLYAHTSPD